MVGPEVKAALHERNFEAAPMDEMLITVVNCHDRCKRREATRSTIFWTMREDAANSFTDALMSAIWRILFFNGDSFEESGNDTLYTYAFIYRRLASK